MNAAWAGAFCLVTALGLAGCGPLSPPPHARHAPDDPAAVAVAVFELAAARVDPSDERLTGLIPTDLDDTSRAALGDALAALATIGEIRVVGRSEVSPNDRTAIDLEAALPGGGSARYVAECRRGPDGQWRLGWFGGPGVEWPRRPSSGEGLSVSTNPH